MRLLPLMLLVVCCSVRAEWVRVFSDDEITVYIDKESVKKDGNRRRIWSLINYSEDRPEKSASAYEEHDCKEGSYRLLQLFTYSGDMGTGKVLFRSSTKDSWEFIRPGSVVAITHRLVCPK